MEISGERINMEMPAHKYQPHDPNSLKALLIEDLGFFLTREEPPLRDELGLDKFKDFL